MEQFLEKIDSHQIEFKTGNLLHESIKYPLQLT